MFETIIEPLKENFSVVKSRVSESAAFNSVKEKYVQLPSKVQKIVGIAIVALVTILLFSIPISRYRASLAYDQEFNEKRMVIKKLLEISGAPKQSGLSQFSSPDRLKSLANRKLQSMSLNSQGESFIQTSPPKGSLAKSPIRESSYKVELKNLNLKQAIAAGHGLQGLMPLGKLTGLKMYKSPEMPGYLNAEYILSFFEAPKEEPKKDSKKPKKRN